MSRHVHTSPSTDRTFRSAAFGALEGLDDSLSEDEVADVLTALLRLFYPLVEVHRQEVLARTRGIDIWYAYRDGAPSGLVLNPSAMPYPREAEAILAIWREVERGLETAATESDRHIHLLDHWARLRAEYQRLIELAREQHRPEPDPWPERELAR